MVSTDASRRTTSWVQILAGTRECECYSACFGALLRWECVCDIISSDVPKTFL